MSDIVESADVEPAETGAQRDGEPSAPRRCAFPGCTRPAEAASGTGGRPPADCGETVLGTQHNPAHAATARRRPREAGISGERATTEPVTVARVAAGDLLTRVEAAIVEQQSSMTRLLDQMRAMGSPDVAAA